MVNSSAKKEKNQGFWLLTKPSKVFLPPQLEPFNSFSVLSAYVRKGSRRNTSRPYRVPTFTPTNDIITCLQGRTGWQNTTSHGGTNINQTDSAKQTGWREDCRLQIARTVTLAAGLWNADVWQISVRMIQNKFKNRVCCRLWRICRGRWANHKTAAV